MSVVADVAARDSPYKGLTPYGREDARFFVGREDETRIIAANLLAVRLTLVYGPSGVGKSSLLAAGVRPTLDALSREGVEADGAPGHVTVSFPSDFAGTGDRRASWRDDPMLGIVDAIGDAVARLGLKTPAPHATDLTGLLQGWSDALGADILLILDQFEEYFLYHGEEVGDNTLAEQLPRIVGRLGLPVNVLISIREDAYTQLDRFKGRIPSLYDNYLRVGHLTREGGQRAIEEPVDRYNEFVATPGHEFSVEPELTHAVLHEVRSGAVVLGQSGRGAIADDEGEVTGIETPFLQLVLERLWAEAREDESRTLRLATLERLGAADRIVRSHLDAAMATLRPEDQDAAARVFGRLVTLSRSKIATLGSDLAAMEQLPQQQVVRMLERLADERVLRPVAPPAGSTEPRYEIFHDVLAPGVLEWRARWLQGREDAERQRQLQADLERQERERAQAQEQAERDRALASRSRKVALVAGVCALIAVVGAIAALIAWNRAEKEQERANVSELVRDAESALQADPSRALALSARAVTQERQRRGGPSDAALEALRHALRASHLVAVLKPRDQAVSYAAFSSKTGRAVTAAGDRLDVWAPETGAHVAGVDIGDGELLRAAWSPDGRTVVGGTVGRSTVAWRVGDARVRVLGRSGGPVVRVGVAPHGVVMAASATDNVVRFFTLTKRAAPRRIQLHSRPTVVALSPDGRRLVVGGRQDPPTLYSSRTGQPMRRLDWPKYRQTPIRAAAFSRDGRRIAIGTGARTASDDFGVPASATQGTARVHIWDVASGRKLTTRRTPSAVTSLAFAPSGARLVVGSADGIVRTWRPGSGSKVTTLTGHGDRISSVAYSNDGRWIVSASRDGTARLWSAAAGTPLAVLAGHEDWVNTAAFSQGGQRVLTQSGDGSARFWRVPFAASAPELSGTAPSRGPATDPAGRRILLQTGVTATVRDLAGKGRPVRIDRRNAWFAGLSRSGQVVLTADPDHIGAWSSKSGRQIFKKRIAVEGPPTESDDGRWLLVHSDGIRPWNAETGALHKPLPSSKALRPEVTTLSPNGRFAAARTRAGRLQVWDVGAGTAVGPAPKIPPGVPSVSPDGKQVALAHPESGGIDVTSTVGRASATTLWNTETGRRRNAVLNTHGAVSVIRFSPDGKLILTVSDENAARVWNARDGHPIATLRGHTAPIAAATFGAGSRLVATGSDDGTARVWDARSGEELEGFRQGARGDVTDVSFDAAARRVIVSTLDDAAVYPCAMCGDDRQLLALAAKHMPSR